MRLSSAILTLCAVLSASAGAVWAEATFTAKPTVAKDAAGGFKISFAVSEPTDVEVAILDAKGNTAPELDRSRLRQAGEQANGAKTQAGKEEGRIVRHLAAGLVGANRNAPAPFKPDSLAQELTWDGKDDLGKVAAGPFTVRILLGSKPKLDQVVGWDGATLGSAVVGMVVGKGGELFVLDSDRGWGRAGMRVFDKDGKYLRTIVPYPAGTPAARTAGTFPLDIEGEQFPMVFDGHCGNLLPLFSGMKNQTMAWNPKGYLVLFSAVGTIAQHGPPRHLLAMHPEGGAPEGVSFVGPEIRSPVGFLGGAGERDVNFYDHLAVSPDGQYVYLTMYKFLEKAPRHAVFRVKWSDKAVGPAFAGKDGESGADDAHLSEPQGLATDPAGNVYVCDRGNNRVMVYSPDGKLLGKFPVEFAYQIAVHPKTGEIYVLSRQRPATAKDKIPPTVVRKFSAWGKGEVKELAKLEGVGDTIALDPESSPVKLWVNGAKGIAQLLDKGAAFEVGATITNTNGLAFPMFIAADPARNRVLVREKSGGMMALDLATGKLAPLGIKGYDAALDREGNIYMIDGYGTDSLSRYTPDGQPLPFSGLGSNKIATGKYRGYGPNMGLRGHCVAPNGDIYLIRSNNFGGVGDNITAVIDVIGPDGKPKKAPLVKGLGCGDCGLGVDAAGNVYVGVNVKPKDKPFPAAFMGQVSADPYVWWRKGVRQPPWHYIYYNPYLYHWGSVMKFGPEGGTMYGNSFFSQTTPPTLPALPVTEAPANATSIQSGYLAKEIKIVGMKWRYAGCGPLPTSDCNWGDPSCVCMTSHLAVDDYGRTYAPNAFRFSVEMIDTNGNQVARIGRYGNADDGKAAGGSAPGTSGSAAARATGNQSAGPDIAFAWPAFVSTAGGKVYIADPDNRRIVIVAFDHAAEATCEVR